MLTTPLYEIYTKYEAKVMDFHHWSLPLQFSGIIEEHLSVRKNVGIFDVSHMGELIVEGKDAAIYLDLLLTNRISDLKPGFIRYSPMCYPEGGTIDDLLVYCLESERYLLVVNASNIISDFEWLEKNKGSFKVVLKNNSNETAQIAIQGPNSTAVIQKVGLLSGENLKYYQFDLNSRLDSTQVLLSRTGYTGEDGFEIYCQAGDAITIWEELMEAGSDFGIKPVGLGARDTLRLEASLPLYGNELSPTISPLEAGLERFIKFDKNNFNGKNQLVKQNSDRKERRFLVGLEMVERGIPRSGYQVFYHGSNIGVVTSGSYCPYLNKNLAMALIYYQELINEEPVQVDIRGKQVDARIISLPFYSRKKGVG